MMWVLPWSSASVRHIENQESEFQFTPTGIVALEGCSGRIEEETVTQVEERVQRSKLLRRPRLVVNWQLRSINEI